VASALLSVPVLVLSMVPALQFDNWQWLVLQLATPVVVWGGWPFHRAAWLNLRHGTATMDTLISVATLAAWLWSLYALFFGEAGVAGMKMEFDPIPEPGAGDDQIYLEVAAVVTTFVLAGRHFEARAKRRAGAALTALLKLGAREASRLDVDGNEDRVGSPLRRLHPRGRMREGRPRLSTTSDWSGGLSRRSMRTATSKSRTSSSTLTSSTTSRLTLSSRPVPRASNTRCGSSTTPSATFGSRFRTRSPRATRSSSW
jgi:hypothetical protein